MIDEYVNDDAFDTMHDEIVDALREQLSEALKDADVGEGDDFNARIEAAIMSANSKGGGCWLWYASATVARARDATRHYKVTGEAELRSGRLQQRARRRGIDGAFDYTLCFERTGTKINAESVRVEIAYYG